jgi:hypothetical protein
MVASPSLNWRPATAISAVSSTAVHVSSGYLLAATVTWRLVRTAGAHCVRSCGSVHLKSIADRPEPAPSASQLKRLRMRPEERRCAAASEGGGYRCGRKRADKGSAPGAAAHRSARFWFVPQAGLPECSGDVMTRSSPSEYAHEDNPMPEALQRYGILPLKRCW